MGLFDHFPYTNFHELNLDWLLNAMKELASTVENFIQEESIKFADPIGWVITKQYAKNTIVLDNQGTAFLSKKPVPAGIQLSNEDYWLKIFDFINYQETFNKNITFNVEMNTTQATAAYNVGDWLLWDNVLYEVTQNIAINDDLLVDTNIVHFTIEELLKRFMDDVNALIQQYKNDIDGSELQFTTNLQNQFDQLVSSVTVDSEVINARLDIQNNNHANLRQSILTQIELACNTLRDAMTTVTINWENGYLNGSGAAVVSSNWKVSQFINVLDFVNISGTFTANTGNLHFAYYDRYGGYLGGSEYGDATIFSKTRFLPSTAAFIRISTTNANTGSVVVKILRDNIRDAGFVRADTVFSAGFIKPDGTIQPSVNWKHTGLVPARKYVKYGGAIGALSSSVGCNLAFYNQNGEFVRGAGLNMDLGVAEYVIPMQNDEYYVALSIPNAISNGYFAPYVSSLEDISLNKVKIVSPSERGTFRSVTAAVAAAVDGDIIFVKRGTYADEHIKAWGKQISIIGEDKLSTILTCSDSSYSNPLIEMSCGVIENLTLQTIGGNDGYTLHDEDPSSFGKNFTIKNCIIESQIGHSAIGMGMHGNSHIEIIGCELRTNSADRVLYVHDSNDPQYVGTYNLNIIDNLFINNGQYIMSLQSQHISGNSTAVTFTNNTFYRADIMSESGLTVRVKQPDNTYVETHNITDLPDWYVTGWSRLNNMSQVNRNTFG